ncbi:hypothetical protein [Chengkuizengella sediminis]|uniref:hypothetical protein n=1 Tax=Chengkuizengella sediminis TaxID=1885917 RepID=UPI00138A2731|nr:hypothetical protein [Chengkuizengella sediminis]NDI36607.1 hypothetical protein [Chengkuizengella sediminis]
MDKNNKKTYMNRVLELSKTYDKAMKQFRDQYLDSQAGRLPNWKWVLLMKPITQLGAIKKIKNQFMELVTRSLSLPIIGATVLPFVQADVLFDTKIWATLFLLIGYIVVLGVNFRDMGKLKNPSFHIDVYKLVKKEEYDLYAECFRHDFSFSELYQYMHGQITTREINDERFADKMSDSLSKLKTTFDVEKDGYIQRYDELLNDYDLTFQHYEDKLFENDYLIDFLKKIKIFLARLENGNGHWYDLDILPFTIYEMDTRTQQIVKREDVKTLDEIKNGTTFHLKDDNYKNHSSVKALKNQENNIITYEYDDFDVITIKKNQQDNKIWVFNFILENDEDFKKLPDDQKDGILILIIEIVSRFSFLLYNKKGWSDQGVISREKNH